MKILITIILIGLFAIVGNAQVDPSTEMKICISPEAANKCRDNAAEVTKIPLLEQALKQKDEDIKTLKALNDKNIADLVKRINELTAEIAFTKGQLVGKDAQIVWQLELLKVALPRMRKKCIVNIIFC